MDLTRWAMEQFLRLALVTARVSGLFLVAPGLSTAGIPRRVKVGLAGIVALVILPALPLESSQVVIGAMGLRAYLVAMFGELLVGAAIGLVPAIVLTGIELGGLFVGRQTGLAFANVMNPISGSQVSVMGRFYGFLALVVFLTIGGHRMLVLAVCRSFEVAPLGAFQFNAEVPAAIVGLSGQIFTIGLAVAAPVLVTLVLITVALGLIARTVPQMNILVIGFPVRILLGWLVVVISLGAVVVLSRNLFLRMFEDLFALVELM